MPEFERYSALIAQHRAELERMGVTSASITGSVARGDSTPESDLDIVVDYDTSIVRTTFDLVRVQRVLRKWLGRDVDVISSRALRLSRHSAILRDARVVF